METCWPKIAIVETELSQQNPEKLVLFIKHLASQNLLTSHMLRGVLDATTTPEKTWREVHAFFKELF